MATKQGVKGTSLVSWLRATTAAGQGANKDCKSPHRSEQTIGNRNLNHGSNRPKGKANHLVIVVKVTTTEHVFKAKSIGAKGDKVGDAIRVTASKGNESVAINLGNRREIGGFLQGNRLTGRRLTITHL